MDVKAGLEAGNVGTAFCVVNVVAETKDVLMEFIHILKSTFNSDAFRLALKADNIMKCFFIAVQVADESSQTVRFMINFLFLRRDTFVFIYNS